MLDRLGNAVGRELIAHLADTGLERTERAELAFREAVELVEQVLVLGPEGPEAAVGRAQIDELVGVAGDVDLKLRVLR